MHFTGVIRRDDSIRDGDARRGFGIVLSHWTGGNDGKVCRFAERSVLSAAECRLRNALKNQKFCSALREVIDEADVKSGCPKQMGSLLYTLAARARRRHTLLSTKLMDVVQCPTKALSHRKRFAAYIKEEKIKVWPTAQCSMQRISLAAQSNAQLDGGLDYLKSLGDAEFDRESFEKAAGVGVEVMASQIGPCSKQVTVCFL